MQVQNILMTLVDGLLKRQQTATPPSPQTRGPVDINQILQVAIGALTGQTPIAPSAGGTATGTAPPILSVIDQLFGGQALAGKKTLLAVIAYVILAILQATGVAGTATGDAATPAGQILTTLIGAFAALGGAAKVDRLTQAIGQAAGQSLSAQK